MCRIRAIRRVIFLWRICCHKTKSHESASHKGRGSAPGKKEFAPQDDTR